jgi:hypothetical protein
VPTPDDGPAVTDCPGDLDFTHPDFAFTARMTDIHAGESRFACSMDRGKTWQGPYHLPSFGLAGTAARTDYLVDGKHAMTLFLTVPKWNGKEGRVVCARTADGAGSWTIVSAVTPEPPDDDYAIMPSSVRLDASTILTAVRYRHHIQLYRSLDNGTAWTDFGRPAPHTGGNPPAMLKMKDGRLALAYGYRLEPYGIRARLSADDGATWSDEVVLRSDGARWDLGYPRMVQRPDGALVLVYYFNADPMGERFIAATQWNPGPQR